MTKPDLSHQFELDHKPITWTSGKVITFYNIAKIIKKITGTNLKIKHLKRNGPIPHNGYRAFNIGLIKKNFKTLNISSVQRGIKKY